VLEAAVLVDLLITRHQQMGLAELQTRVVAVVAQHKLERQEQAAPASLSFVTQQTLTPRHH
jgi:hypothetical protein